MKFVKGDAIAGLIITMVNLLAGVVVGVLYHGMSAGEAANRFAILSIGDAMVSSIPSLFICVAAGVLITRVADETQKKPRSLGQEILAQLTSNTRAMYLAAGLVLAFAAIPGFPIIPFAALSLGLALAARALARQRSTTAEGGAAIGALQREGAKGEAPRIQTDAPAFARPLALCMSSALAARLDAPKFDDALSVQRKALQAQLGLPFPGVAMWANAALPDSCFEVLLNDVPLRRVMVPAGRSWLSDETSPLAAAAERFGPLLHQTESLWLAPEAVPADQQGACLGVEDVMARQVMALLRRHAHAFMGIQEVQWVIDNATVDYPGLVAEVQKILPLQRIAEVLRRLLEEQVPIRNLRSIFESLIAWGPKEKDVLQLTEYVRGDLGRYLAFEAGAGLPFMQAILLDPGVEQSIRQCIKPTPAGNYLAMAPEAVAAISDKVEHICSARADRSMGLVASMDIRRYVKKMIEPRLDWLRVYSYQELGGFIELRPIGRVSA